MTGMLNDHLAYVLAQARSRDLIEEAARVRGGAVTRPPVRRPSPRLRVAALLRRGGADHQADVS